LFHEVGPGLLGIPGLEPYSALHQKIRFVPPDLPDRGRHSAGQTPLNSSPRPTCLGCGRLVTP